MSEITRLTFKDASVILELDSGEILKISYDAYTAYKISSGLNLSHELYSELKEESQKLECMEKACGYLALKARSIDELRRYLKKKNFSGLHIEETINYLKQKNYLNDYNFSLSYIKSKMKNGRHGKDLIIRDLYRKGVSRKIIDKTTRESGTDIPDEDAAYDLAIKKYMSIKDKENSLMKVSNFLRGRGFDYETINKTLRRIKSDFDQ
jgi:regulatory protein